jgi:peptidoglycan hydrolase-like protein with peptidoglycan-binding domain
MPRQVSQGDEGQAVMDLQELLNRKTGADIEEDGIFGHGTHHAVVAFQRSVGLYADGIAGPRTWEALEEAEDVE